LSCRKPDASIQPASNAKRMARAPSIIWHLGSDKGASPSRTTARHSRLDRVPALHSAIRSTESAMPKYKYRNTPQY
jgi:hypothetical protein